MLSYLFCTSGPVNMKTESFQYLRLFVTQNKLKLRSANFYSEVSFCIH